MTSSVMTLQAAAVRLADEVADVGAGAVVGMDVVVVGDVVAVVLERRGIEGQQPEGVDAEILQIVELFGEALEVADAVAVAVAEGLDVQLVDDGVLVPERIVFPVRRLSNGAVAAVFAVGLVHHGSSAHRK